MHGSYPKSISRNLTDYYQQEINSGLLLSEWIYMTFHSQEDKKLRNWIGTSLGREPVIYDRYKTKKTNKQFELYLNNKGYLNANVTDSVKFEGQKAYITYHVHPEAVYRIDTILYTIPDDDVRELYLKHRGESLIKKNRPLDVDNMKEERNRIADLLREHGYYYFNKQYVNYVIDTALIHNQVKLNLQIQNPRGREEGHVQYRIDSVLIYPNYDPNMSLKKGMTYMKKFDTIPNPGNEKLLFMQSGHYRIKQSAIMRENYIFPDSMYARSVTDRTYRHLLGLGAFKFVNIDYQKSSRGKNSEGHHYLNCYVQLTPMVKQSYSLNIEGTNTSGNFGIAGNLSYQHKNFFKGAESFDFSIRGAQEAQGNIVEDPDQQNNIQLFNTLEYGFQSKIGFPHFLFPFVGTSFSRKYNPSSNLSLAYNYQQRPDYTRTIINTTFGYVWSSPGNLMMKHYLNPLGLNLVNVPQKSAGFLESITNPYILNSYQDQLILSAGYSMVYDNKEKKQLRNHIFLRTNLESSGNVLNAFSNLIDAGKSEDYYEVYDIRYAQYVKTDVDFRYYHKVDNQNKLVYRFFAGIVYPYGNSGNSTPFIKKYYSGGANSLRAWPVRGVGPGTYSGESTGINNQLGDIKLEANIEHRFDMFWIIEGALFLDAGNIWELPKSAGNEKPAFHFDTFHEGIAVGSGFGTRFDLSFFILRLDFGVKLRDPSRSQNERWLPGNKRYKFSDFTVNFGISYPF